MRIERCQHTVNRGFDQVGWLDLFNILGADSFKDVTEQIELFIDTRLSGLFLCKKRPGDLG